MEDQLTFVARVDFDRVAVADFAAQHAAGERVLNQARNRAECGCTPNCGLVPSSPMTWRAASLKVMERASVRLNTQRIKHADFDFAHRLLADLAQFRLKPCFI